MLLKNIEPYVRQALITTLKIHDENDVFNELQTYDCRLFYILSNKGNIIIENKTYPLKYGSIILFQSGTKYMWQLENNSELRFITVNFDYTHNFSHKKKSLHPVHSNKFIPDSIFEHINFENAKILNKPVVVEKISSFESKIRLLSTEFLIKNKYCDELLTSLMKTLIVIIVRNQNDIAIKRRSSKYIREVIEYIQNNYSNNITNETIANELHLNPVYLNRVFKNNTNMSIHSFVINYRLNVAMTLLRSENVSVKEVSHMVGYDDPIQFSKMFKKNIGITPKQYRNNAN